MWNVISSFGWTRKVEAGRVGWCNYVVRFLLHKTAGRIPRTRQPSGNSRFYAHVYEYQGRLYMRKVGLQCIHIRVLISTSEKTVYTNRGRT